MRQDYLSFLTELIDDGIHTEYSKLLWYFFNIEYRWDPAPKTKLDANRAADGVDLRRLYFEQTGYRSEREGEPCCVLEMMVALSLRVEENIMGEPGHNHLGRWFWEMVENLKLDIYKDENFDQNDVSDIVGNWMSRNYSPDGKGSMFPLKTYNEDQRKLTLWDQMGAYLVENYT